MLTKNQKISRGLRKYHRHKKAMRDVKILCWIILFIAIISQFVPWRAEAPEAIQRSALPIAGEREMTIRERIYQEVKRSEHPEWASYVYKLAYWESIKICGEEAETCINDKGNTPANSVDRGVLMINNHWHPEVSDECSYNVECSVRFAIDMIAKGQQSQWVGDKHVKGVPLEIVMR